MMKQLTIFFFAKKGKNDVISFINFNFLLLGVKKYAYFCQLQ